MNPIDKLRDKLAKQHCYDDFVSFTQGTVREVITYAEKLRSAQQWRLIETAPHEELVVLGWFEGDTWKQEIGLASAGERYDNGYSSRWWHGQATHWAPLLPPPEKAA